MKINVGRGALTPTQIIHIEYILHPILMSGWGHPDLRERFNNGTIK